MAATVSGSAVEVADVKTPRPPIPALLVLAARRASFVLCATVLTGAFTAWLGTYQASLPSAFHAGQSTIPVWRLLALFAAVLPLVALRSRLVDLEPVATRRLRQSQRIYLAGVGLGCAAFYLGISAATLPPLILPIIARSWLGWLGLALIAGSIVGWRLAWVLSVTVACVFWYWGYQGGAHYAWWEFSARPFDDVPSLLLCGAMLAAGIAAYWATPWRRRRWTFHRWTFRRQQRRVSRWPNH